MRVLLGVLAGLVATALAFVLLSAEPREDGVFHPDHSRVFNGFQEAASDLVGDVSSVPPDSECRQVDSSTWRCYRRWAPIGRPDGAEILEAEVNVYEDRVVVGRITRQPD